MFKKEKDARDSSLFLNAKNRDAYDSLDSIIECCNSLLNDQSQPRQVVRNARMIKVSVSVDQPLV